MILGVDVEVASGTRHRRHNLTATIGLVVHAAGTYIRAQCVTDKGGQVDFS